jgi:hypothetical protein
MVIMTIHNTLKYMVQYITEAFIRIFGPNDDQYPSIGVQPFEGEIYQPQTGVEW